MTKQDNECKRESRASSLPTRKLRHVRRNYKTGADMDIRVCIHWAKLVIKEINIRLFKTSESKYLALTSPFRNNCAHPEFC